MAMRGQGSGIRGAVTSLFLLLVLVHHVPGVEVQVTDGSVNLQHIKDLSAQIDLKTAFTTWLRHPHPATLPHPHSGSALLSQSPDDTEDPLTSTADDGHSHRAAVHDHHHRQLSDPVASWSRSSVTSSQHLPTQPPADQSSDTLTFPQTSPRPAPARSRGQGRPGTAVGDDAPSSVSLADDFQNDEKVRFDETETNQVEQRKTKAEADKTVRWSFQDDLSSPTHLGDLLGIKQGITQGRQPPLSTQTGEDHPLPRQKRSLLEVPDPAVTHMSAKRLSRLEADLARRRQTEPEHKLYHQDLLLRRLKALRQHRQHGAPDGPSQGRGQGDGEDDWTEELRIRGELAEKAVQYGVERRKERLAHPDPSRPLSVLDRIHRDAEEILKRRAQEEEYRKKTLKHQAKTNTHHGQSSAVDMMALGGEVPDAASHVHHTDQAGQKADSPLTLWQGKDHSPAKGRSSPVSAKRRRRMKHRSKALERVLGGHRSLL